MDLDPLNGGLEISSPQLVHISIFTILQCPISILWTTCRIFQSACFSFGICSSFYFPFLILINGDTSLPFQFLLFSVAPLVILWTLCRVVHCIWVPFGIYWCCYLPFPFLSYVFFRFIIAFSILIFSSPSLYFFQVPCLSLKFSYKCHMGYNDHDFF